MAKKNSKKSILIHAEQVLREKGYEGMSMQQIATRVGLTKAALYYHFPEGKDQLVTELLQTGFSEYLLQMKKIIDTTGKEPKQVLHKAIVHYINCTLSNGTLILLIEELKHENVPLNQTILEMKRAIVDMWKPLIKQVVELNKKDRHSVDITLITHLFLGMLHTYVTSALICKDARTYPTKRVADHMILFLS